VTEQGEPESWGSGVIYWVSRKGKTDPVTEKRGGWGELKAVYVRIQSN